MNDILINHELLRNLCTDIQVGFGIPRSDAETVSDCLVEANLMGLDTHGVIRLKFYMDRIKAGGNNPLPNIHIVKDNLCSALLDADNALGPVGGKRAMDLALEKAKLTGIGIVLIRNCNHYGPAGYYARIPLKQNMIGISLTNVLASMPPTGGAETYIGNNAYSIAFPAKDEPPVVVDGATSIASWGKVFLCAQEGKELPEGCYIDSNGNLTVKPQDVINGGALLPFAGHKGYGIAVAIELLTGMLADTFLDHEIIHPYKELSKAGRNTFFMSVIRINDFMEVEKFMINMDNWIRSVRAIRKSQGIERIWLPGEKESITREQRLAYGIPLSPAMIDELKALAKEVGVLFNLAPI